MNFKTLFLFGFAILFSVEAKCGEKMSFYLNVTILLDPFRKPHVLIISLVPLELATIHGDVNLPGPKGDVKVQFLNKNCDVLKSFLGSHPGPFNYPQVLTFPEA